MNKYWFNYYANGEYWDSLSEEYIRTGKLRNAVLETDLWDYFKFCFITGNRYCFQHPLLQAVKEKILQHVTVLPENSTVFRARLDTESKLCRLSENNFALNTTKKQILQCEAENDLDGLDFLRDTLKKFASVKGIMEYSADYEAGYEGFNAKGSSAPPIEKASAGRCNPENIIHLYAAREMHTAVAEIRPYINDSISIASLRVKRQLRLINFYYNASQRKSLFEDGFFSGMMSEFSDVNKGNEHDYVMTQFLTMLIKDMGFDGIQFRSSLAFDGMNYVIFNPTVCEAISSKLYTIPMVHFDLTPKWTITNLKDSDGNIIPDPPLSQELIDKFKKN